MHRCETSLFGTLLLKNQLDFKHLEAKPVPV